MPSSSNLRVEHELFVRSILPVAPPARVVSQMAARMHDHTFAKNQVIFERGDPSHNLYFVVDGEVGLQAPGAETWRFARGSLVGITDATLGRRHARTARALSLTHVVSIGFEDYADILEDNFEFTKTTLESALATIHEQSKQLAPDGVFGAADLRGGAPLPMAPGQAVSELQCLLALRDVTALSQAPVQPLVTLSKAAQVQHWAPGAKIFSAGQPANEIFVLVGGRVQVIEAHLPYEAEFEPGSILGAHAAFAYETHPHHAIALEASTTLCLAKEDVFDVIEDHFGLGRTLFAWVATENERARDALSAHLRLAEKDRSEPPI